MPEVAGHECEVVAQRGCGYLQVRVGQAHPIARERGAEATVDVGHVRVERQYGHGWQHPLREHLEVPLPRQGPVRPVELHADGDRARELVVALDCGEPRETSGEVALPAGAVGDE